MFTEPSGKERVLISAAFSLQGADPMTLQLPFELFLLIFYQALLVYVAVANNENSAGKTSTCSFKKTVPV